MGIGPAAVSPGEYVVARRLCDLLWSVLRRFRVPSAWFGAALWAVHPVRSIGGVDKRDEEHGTGFVLTWLSILFFVKWLKTGESRNARSGWNYALTLLFAALAMASKSSTVVLPVSLLCAWWMEGRWHWRNLARVAADLFMSIAASALSIWTQGKFQLVASHRSPMGAELAGSAW